MRRRFLDTRSLSLKFFVMYNNEFRESKRERFNNKKPRLKRHDLNEALGVLLCCSRATLPLSVLSLFESEKESLRVTMNFSPFRAAKNKFRV